MGKANGFFVVVLKKRQYDLVRQRGQLERGHQLCVILRTKGFDLSERRGQEREHGSHYTSAIRLNRTTPEGIFFNKCIWSTRLSAKLRSRFCRCHGLKVPVLKEHNSVKSSRISHRELRHINTNLILQMIVRKGASRNFYLNSAIFF